MGDVGMAIGDMDALPALGLLLLRFGEGVSGGLPGSDGAQTICSGVTESSLTDKFSLLSIKHSNSARNCSLDIRDANDNDRSRRVKAGDNRLTDKSKGVVVVSLLGKHTND